PDRIALATERFYLRDVCKARINTETVHYGARMWHDEVYNENGCNAARLICRLAGCLADHSLNSLSTGRLVEAPFTPLVVAFDRLATDVLQNAADAGSL